MQQLIQMPLTEFVATTASGAPVPGGGSISALCASLSAALGAMVANLTIGKKKYADVEPQMRALADKLTPASQLLLKAVDMDSDAYDQVFQAYKLPKDTPEQIQARTFAIQQALRHAADVPMSVAQMVCTFLDDLVEIGKTGNQNAITDAYVAALCARTAVYGATANVRINLTSITDEAYVATAQRDLLDYERRASQTEDALRALVNAALS